MSKLIKKVLVTGASLLMLVSFGTGINNVQAKHYHHARTHRTYHYSSWRKGTPSVFHKRSYWVSNYLHLRNKYSKAFLYRRYVFPMTRNKGIDLFSIDYQTKYGKGLPGTDTSAFAESYPYYKVLGHGKYLITCGDSNVVHKHGHLYYDLEDNIYLVKMHGHNHLSLWSCDTRPNHHRKYYSGYYTRHTHNMKQLIKMLRTGKFYIS